jgi:MmyB-like transcription regulator ligand binding domain
MSAVRAAVRQVLAAHEPYPAVVVDRRWNMVDANSTITTLLADVAAPLLAPPVNVLRVSLHPEGLAPRIANLGEWRAHLLGRLRRQVALTADTDLTDLYEELRGYPCDQPEPEVELPGPGDVVVPLRLRYDDGELAFFSTVATFGTPLDITVAELAIESFFPADDVTASALRAVDR